MSEVEPILILVDSCTSILLLSVPPIYPNHQKRHENNGSGERQNTRNPDIYEIGSIKKRLHRGRPKPLPLTLSKSTIGAAGNHDFKNPIDARTSYPNWNSNPIQGKSNRHPTETYLAEAVGFRKNETGDVVET
jgi:hypothetical protein